MQKGFRKLTHVRELSEVDQHQRQRRTVFSSISRTHQHCVYVQPHPSVQKSDGNTQSKVLIGKETC